MKRGRNKKGYLNLNTECPIAVSGFEVGTLNTIRFKNSRSHLVGVNCASSQMTPT